MMAFKIIPLLLLLWWQPTESFLNPSKCNARLISLAASRNHPPPFYDVVEDDGNDSNSGNDSDAGSKPYIPPDFTIEDEDEPVNTEPRRKVPRPPIRRVVKQEKEVSEERVSSPRIKIEKRPKRKTVESVKMAGTSWMQKNAKFSGEDGMDMQDSLSSTDRFDSTATRGGSDSNPGSARSGKSFRQDFRGTRVFVQGIPQGISWQDLKDHFQVAGNVVFASISVDLQTGQTKGHGIVQFEATSMAQNAIDIMRNYPLAGSTLFVREDVQEGRSDARLRSAAPKGPTPPTKWQCANEENASFLSEDEQSEIRQLIKSRDMARRQKKYEESDRIRDELKSQHGVFIDDRLKMWWTSVDGSKVPKTIQDIKGDGRWKLTPWRQIPTTPENDACVDPDLVEGLLKQRDISRREKDFSTADTLLEEARVSPDGDLTLRIHDESRTWRVWTEAPPPRPVEHRDTPDYEDKDPVELRKLAAKECIEIVKEHDPEKIGEIKMVLQKFVGREFQVLKRIRKQYLNA